MTVTARPDNDLAPPVTPRLGPFGGDTPVRAGTYPFDGDDLVADWHTHDLHQLQ